MGAAPPPPVSARESRLVARPRGAPRTSDFETAHVGVSSPAPGELLVRNTWMSVDPSVRLRMDDRTSSYLPPFELGRPLEGWAVGVVVESRAPGYSPGDVVLHGLGWREYAIVRADVELRLRPERVTVNDTTPDRAYLGPLSWVSLTPWVALLDVAELQEGDIVFVSAAAGAVGSLAVQIAKRRGHIVVGSAGSPEKVAFVRDELGADAAFCYRDGPVTELLRQAAPQGIDVYLDNVGGEHLEAALDAMRPRGRIALCGAISSYNQDAPTVGPSNLFEAVTKGLTLRGFLARMYADRMDAFRADMRRWMADGGLVYREQVYDGIESAPRALIDLLSGRNTGKVLVKL